MNREQTADTDERFMRLALAQARLAFDAQEVPVGAVVVRDGEVLGSGFNHPIGLCDPTAHAEMRALRSAAGAEQNYRLPGSTLYVTIEPCVMCFGAIIHARVARIVYGASEPKAGVLVSQLQLAEQMHWNHSVEYCGGVLSEEASSLMQQFFRHRRQMKKQLRQEVPPASG